MTIVYRVTDGTTTVELSDQSDTSLAYIDEYAPASGYDPDPETGLVTESSRIVFKNTSLANVVGETRTLKQLLSQAAAWEKDRSGAQVFAKFQPDSTLTLMRAPLRIPPNSRVVGSVQEDRKTTLHNGIVTYRLETDIVLTHSVWEADSEIAVPLLSFATSPKTANPVTIHNHTDSGHGHYVDIAAADVIGDCKVPLRLVIVNTTASNQDSIVYVAHQWRGVPASIPSVLEGESATNVYGFTITPTVDATCSNGNYGAWVWAVDGWVTAKWALSAAQVQALAGGKARFLARFKTLPASGILSTVNLHLPGNTTAYHPQPAEQWTTLSTTHYLQDLGSLSIPPSLAGVSSLGALDLTLSFQITGGSTIDLDFLALIPCDSFRCLKAVTTGAVNTDTIMIDDIAGEQYIQAAGGTRTGRLVSTGTPIMLMPGKRQFLYFLFENNVPGMEIDRSHTIQAWYRPRRMTI